MADDKSLPFENAIGELENIVKSLEEGNLSLEEALNTFEKGVGLSKHCQEVLEKAEQKISMLTADNKIEDAQHILDEADQAKEENI